MSNRKEYIDQVAETMKKWDDDIVALESKSSEARDGIKSDIQKKLQDLRIKKAELEGKLEKLKSSGEDAWDILNKEFKESFEKIKNAFDDAKNTMKD
ncbi:MAG: hypothetical protein U5K00_09695 [Melioribacteraceae bacterium]|nr:hypothetical protein [Melioribacteraceae bacterium]